MFAYLLLHEINLHLLQAYQSAKQIPNAGNLKHRFHDPVILPKLPPLLVESVESRIIWKMLAAVDWAQISFTTYIRQSAHG